MNVSQMLKHCTEAIGTATGDVTIKAPFVIKLMGPLIKKLIMSKNQYKQGLPTAKEFIFTDDRNFNIEKTKLIERLQKFYSIGEKSIDGLVHPVFGKLSSFEWGYSQWKHFDHHLRQFGV